MTAAPTPASARAVRGLLACAAFATTVGCRGGDDAPSEPERDLRADIAIRDHALTIETGAVGQGAFETMATYVLIDAVNTGARDLEVTLAGTLETAGGETAGQLRAESLRIPAGGQRTFALVDAASAARPDARRAAIRVEGAAAIGYEPTLRITDGHLYRDRDHLGRDRVIVTGRVKNAADRRARVLVMAGFYGAGEAPVKRPFAALHIDGRQSYPVRFVGPPGSERAYLFIGPSSY